MENNFKDGQYVLIKGIVDYGNAKPGKMVRVRAIDSDLPVWVAPEDLVLAEPDKCDGNE
jgi:hypothetical protein